MQLLSHRRPSVDWEAKVGHQPTLGWFQTSHGASRSVGESYRGGSTHTTPGSAASTA